MKKIHLIFLLIYLTFQVNAQIDNLGWVKNIGGSSFSQSRAISTDQFGNVYIIGDFFGTTDFDPSDAVLNLSAGENSSTVYIQKISPEGELIWVKQFYGVETFMTGLSIHVDNDNNVFVTGLFTETVDFNPTNGTYNLTATGAVDMFVVKLNQKGHLIWAKQMGGVVTDEQTTCSGYFITTDNNGNVYIAGDFEGTVDFDPSPTVANLTAQSVGGFVQKLDANGNFIWVRQLGALNYNRGISVVIDDNDNVYTAGYFSGTFDFDPSSMTNNLTSQGNRDVVIQKLDADGNFVWVKQVGGEGTDWTRSLAINNNNLYVLGSFEETVDFDPSPTVFELTSIGNADAFIQKLDLDGNFIWAKQLAATGYTYPNTITIDNNEDLLLTVNFNGTGDFDPSNNVYEVSSGTARDMIIQKLDADGNFIWAKQMGGETTVTISGAVMDANENVYLTGFFEGTIDFDPSETVYNLTAIGSTDIFVQKMGLLADSCQAHAEWTYSTMDNQIFTFDFSASLDSNTDALTGEFLDYEGELEGTNESNIYTHTFLESGIYTYCLYALSDNCVDTLCQDIAVSIPQNCPIIEAEWSANNGVDFMVDFEGTTGFDTYYWDFGDGTIVENQASNITNTYANEGWYYVQLNASMYLSDSSICSYYYADSIYVSVVANDSCMFPDFEINLMYESTGNDTVLIHAHTQGTTSPFTYLWSTGETTSSIMPTSSETYCVTVTDINGCMISDCIDPSNDTCYAYGEWAHTTTDNITYTFDPSGSYVSHLENMWWEIRDETGEVVGESTSNYEPFSSFIFTFSESGVYSVCLNVLGLDHDGQTIYPCMDYVCQDIVVILPQNCPTIEAEWSANNDVDLMVDFEGTTGFDGYYWDFGDGTIVENQASNITHTYTNEGWYYVQMIGSYNLPDSTVCSYEYADSLYVYLVEVVNDSCFFPWGQVIPYSEDNGDSTVTISIYEDELDSAYAPFTYAWTGPNGFLATTESIITEVSGTYTVAVTNTNGCSLIGFIDIIIDSTEGCPTEEVEIEVINQGQYTIDFIAPDGYETYVWHLGDGNSFTTTSPLLTHTFPSAGWYYVDLTAFLYLSDSIVCGYEYVDSIYVEPIENDPCDSIDIITSIAYTGYATPDGLFYAYAFDGGAAGGTAPYSYFWDFGDGTTSSLEDVFYGFNADSAGTQTVCLSVQDANACSETMCTDIIVGVDSAGLGGTIYSDGSGLQGGIVQKTGLETLADVTVQLKDVLGNVIFETITDENGQYYFDNLFYGTYLVHLDIEGINSPDFRVELMPENPINENFNLTVTEETVLDIGTIELIEAVSVYPNPTTGNTTLEITMTTNERLTITVLNVLGQVVQQVEQDFVIGQNKMDLDLNNVQTGLYLVNIQSDKVQKTLRVVKQ